MIYKTSEYAFFIHRDLKIKFENIVLSKCGMCCCNRALTQTNREKCDHNESTHS